MGADIARIMIGLGKFAATARPDSIHVLGAGSQLCVGLMTCVDAVCKKVDDRRFCSLLGGLSNLGWHPGLPCYTHTLLHHMRPVLLHQWCPVLSDRHHCRACCHARCISGSVVMLNGSFVHIAASLRVSHMNSKLHLDLVIHIDVHLCTGPQLSARLAYRYKRLLAKTWDRESLCMAAVLYASLDVAMPPTMLEATESAALRLQFDASDSRHTRHMLQAFAIRGFLPSESPPHTLGFRVGLPHRRDLSWADK